MAALLASLLFLAACATTPTSPVGAADARNKLSALQADPNLAERAPLELREAEAAVRIAEQPLQAVASDLGEHRVYIAERKIEIARARATERYAMEQREALVAERDQIRLMARTREAERARAEANFARDDASRARDAASSARYSEAQAMANAEAARRDAALAQRSEAQAAANAEAEAADLRRQISALEAEVTDRGLVLTLGDLLFATDRATLEAGADRHLERLVAFLERYPERRIQIEGHTDNVGTGDYNLGLSRRRAESVQNYLTQRGIDRNRTTAIGLGQEQPIASNQTAAGRQQNRRVEIIIENPAEGRAN